MLNIEVKTISHKKQAYNTVGNNYEKGKKRFIRVTDLDNDKYEILIAIHELVEQALRLDHKIPDRAMASFDKKFEKHRTPNKPLEPGDNPKSPYHKEHLFATSIEKILAKKLKVNWKEYGKVVDKIYAKAIRNQIFKK